MIKKLLKQLQHVVHTHLTQQTLQRMQYFLEWFARSLHLHFGHNQTGEKTFFPKRWDIYFIDLWWNIWRELSKNRPCIVISKRKDNGWDTVVILPIKTYKWRSHARRHILLEEQWDHWLDRACIIDLLQITTVSKRRIMSKKIWSVSIEEMNEIEQRMRFLFFSW